MVEGIKTVYGSIDVDEARRETALAIYVIGSTMTSTIPNISLAGSMPIATLFTPALDVEYLQYGKPITIDVIPTTPTGIPTPALITRTALQLSKTPFVVVDAGSYVKPKMPVITLSSGCVGGRIDKENALPAGTSENLFRDAKAIGYTLGSISRIVLVGESIPAGTTTALAILQGLGYNAYNIVSSSSKTNPIDIKKPVVESALKRLQSSRDPFMVNDVVGDPVHISVAGLALGALTAKSLVILAGGTQMLAVLALMKAIEPGFEQKRVVLATTRWIFLDKGREITEFIKEVVPQVAFIYTDLDFSDAPYDGLKAYEEGFVKEGVGAGGTAALAMLKGVDIKDLKQAIYREYGRIVNRVE